MSESKGMDEEKWTISTEDFIHGDGIGSEFTGP